MKHLFFALLWTAVAGLAAWKGADPVMVMGPLIIAVLHSRWREEDVRRR